MSMNRIGFCYTLAKLCDNIFGVSLRAFQPAVICTKVFPISKTRGPSATNRRTG